MVGRVTVIVPTYNEPENLPELIRRIHACAGDSVKVLVMNDSPDDATADVARKAGCQVLQRSEAKKGLSAAVVDGIRLSDSKKVVVMDADLQHPPEALPRLLEALEDSDFVVMSRYVRGGGCEKWNSDRKLISKAANLAARPLRLEVHDLMSGFFGFRRTGLPDLSTVSTRGFKVMLELLVRGSWNSVVEVPYMFEPRVRGESKLSAQKGTEYLLQLLSLYLYRFRWLRFGLVGALGAVIGFPILYTLTEFVGLFYIISAVIAIVCASTSNYFFNNLWTFEEKRRRGKGHIAGWLNYQMLSAVGDGMYLGLLAFFTSVLGIWYMLSAVISIAIAFVFKYLFANRVIWRVKR